MRLRTVLVIAALAAVTAVLYTSDTSYAGVTVLTVNSSEDTNDGVCNASPGDCTLREAINNVTDNDRIEFDIPAATDPGCNIGTGVCTITRTNLVSSPLSETGVVINGYTQLGSSPNTLAVGSNAQIKIEIVGDPTAFDIEGPNFELTGVAIRNNIIDNPINILSAGDNSWIHGNFIGLDAAGTLSTNPGNQQGVVVDGGSELTLGGPSPADRNVIGGFQEAVWLISGTGHVVQGNYIGTNAAGSAAVENSYGLSLSGGASDILISDNLISGNSQGITSQASDLTIRGNYIGLDATGTGEVPNVTVGIRMFGGTDVAIGGLSPAYRNVISGNGSDGINLAGVDNVQIAGNYIGTNAAGTAAIPNAIGINVTGGDNITIGGGQQSARNVISGNTFSGVTLSAAIGDDWSVKRNHIGTDAAGNAAVPNLNGISSAHTGGVITLNLISGNTDSGIKVLNHGGGTEITANRIGTNAVANAGVGNTVAGVTVSQGGTAVIGGTAGADANTIAFNGTGVLIGPVPTGPSRQAQGGPPPVPDASASVLRNNIRLNTNLGIDILPLGHNANDAGDADDGPNNLQNAPELTSAVTGSTTVQGSLDSTPNRDFRFEMFANSNCDSSGYGEGRTYGGSATLHTDADGAIEFSVQSAGTAQVGDIITATVTDLTTNETSEFSNCVTVAAGPTPTPIGQTPSPSPTGPTPTTTPTPIAIDTPEPSVVITDEPTPIATPTPTASPTPTPGPSGTTTTTPLPSDTGSTTPTVTATPTTSASSTPSPTPFVCGSLDTCTPPAEEFIWGDDNCSGEADPVDSLLTLRHDAGLTVDTGDCPEMGEEITHGVIEDEWGDVDCSGEVNPVDSLKLLRFDAGLTVTQPGSCPDIGAAVLVS